MSDPALDFNVHASASVVRGNQSPLELAPYSDPPGLGLGGHFKMECYDKDGNLKWSETLKNGVTNVGLNSVLDVYLRNQTQIATWFMGLIDNASFTGLAAGDTAASHTGWLESAAYSDATRRTWSPAAAASQSISNTTTVDFTINATATLRGAFLISDNTKSGTTGTLFCHAAFSGGNQTVNSGDTLKVTYTINGSAT